MLTWVSCSSNERLDMYELALGEGHEHGPDFRHP